MSHEPLSNIGFTCKEHQPKPVGMELDADLTKLIGKFVKKSFPTGHPRVTNEHMWVEVKEVVDGKLHGTLNNDPIYCSNLKDGDQVDVDIDEIEDICE